ncbi:MAG: YfiR family protein [Vicinamibacterales bacterium]
MQISGRHIINSALLALAMLAPATAVAQVDEYGVKASFVRNFVAFVEWPTNRLESGSPLTICVFNDSPITARLLDLKIAPVRDHHVQVRAVSALPDLAACQAVFIPSTESPHVADILSRYHNAGLLTITETPSTRTGAIINMFVNQSRMAFDIDLEAGRAQGIVVSSKLLSLAHTVHGSNRAGTD